MIESQYYLNSQPLFEDQEDLTQHFQTPPRKKRTYKKKEIDSALEKEKVNYSNSKLE